MSIAQKVNFDHLIAAIESKAAKENEVYEYLYWVYKNYDGELLGCTARTLKANDGGKNIKPWIYKDKWISKGFGADLKPIYGLEKLKIYPNKPVLFVEGEKTADAGHLLFHEFNVVTWLGGTSSAGKADLERFHHMKIYLLPDNDIKRWMF